MIQAPKKLTTCWVWVFSWCLEFVLTHQHTLLFQHLTCLSILGMLEGKDVGSSFQRIWMKTDNVRQTSHIQLLGRNSHALPGLAILVSGSLDNASNLLSSALVVLKGLVGKGMCKISTLISVAFFSLWPWGTGPRLAKSWVIHVIDLICVIDVNWSMYRRCFLMIDVLVHDKACSSQLYANLCYYVMNATDAAALFEVCDICVPALAVSGT